MKTILLTLGCLVLLAAPARAQQTSDSKWLHIGIASLATLEGADTASSAFAFGQLGQRYQEANPLLRWAEHKPLVFGAVKLAVPSASVWLLVKEHRAHPKATLWSLVAMNALEIYVDWSNHRQLSRR